MKTLAWRSWREPTGSPKPFIEIKPTQMITRISENRFVDTDLTRDKPEKRIDGRGSYPSKEKREQCNKLRNIFRWKADGLGVEQVEKSENKTEICPMVW